MTRGIRNVDSKRALEREALISMLEGREILVFFFYNTRQKQSTLDHLVHKLDNIC